MENKMPFKVICIKESWIPGKYEWKEDPKPKKGDVVTVDAIENKFGFTFYSLLEYPEGLFNSDHFAPINPYSNSVSKELANEAIKESIEVDIPIREVVNNKCNASLDEDEDDETEFIPCSMCDGHPACEDYGCAYELGVGHLVEKEPGNDFDF
jgi:hypothetical protein